ncbi:VWA domain-containing protein [Streptomyces sp. NPDC004050]
MTIDFGGSAYGSPAVLYVPRPSGPGPWHWAAPQAEEEIRRRARIRGLRLAEGTAREPDEVDSLLDRYPGAAVLVQSALPGHRPLLRPLLEGGHELVDALIALGATLVVSDEESGPAADVSVRHWARDEAVLLITDPFAPLSLLPDEEWRRTEACERYAQGLGLRPGGRIRDYPSYVDFVQEELRSGPAAVGVTVVIHPAAFTWGPDVHGRPHRHESPVWRWLSRGAVVHSAGRVGLEQESQGVDERRGYLRSRPTARRMDPGPEPAAGPEVSDEAAWDTPDAAADAPRRRFRVTGDALAARLTVGDHNASPDFTGPAFVRPPREPDPPRRDPRQPLPRDGLFIRRTTAYGTRAHLGITELIDNGVLIGQDQIRFDDFVASRTDQVPGPDGGEAVAVSHGLAAVPGHSKAHEATTHFVEIALKAGAAPTGAAAPPEEPLPVNLVFVVDTSISMAGSKLDTVKAALQEIHRRLRPTDTLGIVTFATNVSTLLPATRKDDLPPERFAQLVAGMKADGGTDINLGIQYGIAEIGRRAGTARTINRLYLFSDGDPTSGETNWTVIRKNLAVRLRGDLTVSCFGFGGDARMDELSALAGTAGGHATFVTRPEEVGTGLLEDLERRDHLAAIDIQLRIDIDPEVVVWHLYGHDLVSDPRARAGVFREAEAAARFALAEYGTAVLPDLITDEHGIRIFAPDLAFGETYWVVLEVQVPDGRADSDGLGTATVQYADTVARESRSRSIILAEGPLLAEETVLVHAVGLRTSEVTYHALDDLYENDRAAAGRRLTEHIRVLKQVHDAHPAEEFVDDRVTLEKLKSLTDSLGTVMSFTDAAAPAPGIRAMNAFAQVRSGYAAF